MEDMKIYLFAQALDNNSSDDWYEYTSNSIKKITKEDDQSWVNNLIFELTDEGERETFHNVDCYYKLNPNRIHNAIWLYNNITLEVDFPDNMHITFQKMGVNKEWDKKFTKNNYYSKLKSEYKGIVFPNQGFLLNYRLK